MLAKGNEKLLHKKHVFQTKDFDNVLGVYKIHRQQLYKRDGSGFELIEAEHTTLTDKWDKVYDSKAVIFYDQIEDDEGNEWEFNFEFTFSYGKLDKKKLISCKIVVTKKERDEIDKMWDTEQEIFNEYRKCFKYCFFAKLEKTFLKLTNWARKKHQLPLQLRRGAYEKSGRLNKDPKALDLYMDI